MSIAYSRKPHHGPSRKSLVALSPAEWDVMKIFWDHGPLAARDVFGKLPADRGWAYKTVKTLLSRLVAKEALAFNQIGNSYLYRAVVDREAMTRAEVRSVFQRLVERGLLADSGAVHRRGRSLGCRDQAAQAASGREAPEGSTQMNEVARMGIFDQVARYWLAWQLAANLAIGLVGVHRGGGLLCRPGRFAPTSPRFVAARPGQDLFAPRPDDAASASVAGPSRPC